jgi:hypothetical protein
MSVDTLLGWQPGLAPVLDQVVSCMNVTHDALILRAGRDRVSGISWEIYGPELAGVLARTRGGGSARGPNVAGTFEEGLTRIAWHASGSIAGGEITPEQMADAMRSDTVDSEVPPPTVDGLVAMFRARAEGFPLPTIVIAYCQVRIRSATRSHR